MRSLHAISFLFLLLISIASISIVHGKRKSRKKNLQSTDTSIGLDGTAISKSTQAQSKAATDATELLHQVDNAYSLGEKAMKKRKFEEASEFFWFAFTQSGSKGGSKFTNEDVYTKLLQSYSARGILDVGYVRIAEALIQQKSYPSAFSIIDLAKKANPDNFDAHMLTLRLPVSEDLRRAAINDAIEVMEKEPFNGKRTEELGVQFFALGDYSQSMKYLQMTYEANTSNRYALSNAIYNRHNICAWGKNATQYYRDIEHVIDIIAQEGEDERVTSGEMKTVILPFFTMNYGIPPELKLLVGQRYSEWEKAQCKVYNYKKYTHTELLGKYQKESKKRGFRIKIGYVSANFKSKAAAYVGQDLFRLHNRRKFEIHVYATSEPDPPQAIEAQMRGVDWREKIKRGAEFFHEVHHLSVPALAELIHQDGIHFLVDWDGHSNYGARAMGLFASTPAPLQVAHQEYIGTMGADYMHYIVTDQLASPLEAEAYYTEKFIYIPHTFLTNSFAYQAPDMSPPERKIPYKRSPQYHGCGGAAASFVYCNFGKQVKYEPNQFRHWLNILQRVENSVLCLLEYPAQSVPYLRSFIDDVNSTLNDRVRFLEASKNPYDHQRRNAQYCNAILDTKIWNGRTTTQDGLWAGVPFVASMESLDMGSRVGADLLNVLGLNDLIAKNQSEYEDIAVRLAKEPEYYAQVRSTIVESCLQTKPRRHPLWDLERHVANLERGFAEAWENFLAGQPPRHIYVKDVIDHPKGSY